VLLILAAGGFIYAAIKKDYFILLWFIPFLIFLAIIGYVHPWHLIPLLPAFCIAAARLIGGGDLYNLIKRKKVQVLLPFVIISAIGIFGLVSTTILITRDNTSSQFEKTASGIQYLLEQANGNNNNNGTNYAKITEEISVDPNSWIFRYIFDLKYYYLLTYL
jgi:4-amino-4-deoxy-L-arabinose transferase-like glycosyltransferase